VLTWFNIPSDDLDRAARFYKSVFGWQLLPISREEDERLDYQMVQTAESDEANNPTQPAIINGCIVRREILPHPTVLITVEDLDEAVQRVVAAGGKKVSEKIVLSSAGGVLQFAEDTEGNVIELWEDNI